MRRAELPPALLRRHLAAFVDCLLTEKQLQPATSVARQRGVCRFPAWLTQEGELEADPLLGVTAPKLDTGPDHHLRVGGLVASRAELVELLGDLGLRASPSASLAARACRHF